MSAIDSMRKSASRISKAAGSRISARPNPLMMRRYERPYKIVEADKMPTRFLQSLVHIDLTKAGTLK
jgi:hypothetical protein